MLKSVFSFWIFRSAEEPIDWKVLSLDWIGLYFRFQGKLRNFGSPALRNSLDYSQRMPAFEFLEYVLDDIGVVRMDLEFDATERDRVERHDRRRGLVLEKIVQAFLVETVFEDLDLVRVMENGYGDEIFHNWAFGVV